MGGKSDGSSARCWQLLQMCCIFHGFLLVLWCYAPLVAPALRVQNDSSLTGKKRCESYILIHIVYFVLLYVIAFLTLCSRFYFCILSTKTVETVFRVLLLHARPWSSLYWFWSQTGVIHLAKRTFRICSASLSELGQRNFGNFQNCLKCSHFFRVSLESCFHSLIFLFLRRG